MRMGIIALLWAISALLSSAAQGKCPEPGDYSPDDVAETDGFTYTMAQTKAVLPTGSLTAARQAVLAAGMSAAYFDSHCSFTTATVDWVYPGCEEWSRVQATWTLEVGDFVTYFSSSSTLVDGVPVPVDVSPPVTHDYMPMLAMDEAAQRLATCSPPRTPGSIGFCNDEGHNLCLWGELAGGANALLNLETDELTCQAAPGAAATGSAGGRPIGAPVSGPDGCRSPTAAPPLPLAAALALLLVIPRRRA